jgi:hypothetical protein
VRATLLRTIGATMTFGAARCASLCFVKTGLGQAQAALVSLHAAHVSFIV